jgi:vacuolar-type H+-ATPase subunit I/STV1
VLPWILGAMMLVVGLIIIAFHQYWRTVTAALISFFGWFVAVRGLAMMAVPSAIQTGAGDTISSPGLLLAARGFFGLLTVMGLWLTYVGWLAPPPVADPARAAPPPVGVSHGEIN